MHSLVRALFITLTVFIATTSVSAQINLDVRGSGRSFPIGLPQLCVSGGDTEANRLIPEVIGKDLMLSGYFDVLNQNSFIESAGKCGNDIAYTDWSVIGAEGVVRGEIRAEGDSQKIQLFLHDVQKQQKVIGKEYLGDSRQISQMAHRFSNEIMRYYTGEPGIFGTQIAFTSRVGRFKELYVMDMDGSNVRQLSNDRGLAVSSSWVPGSDALVYTSYRKRVPDLFVFDVPSKRIRQVTRGSAMEIGAKFSKDGRRVIVSRSSGRDSNIVLLGRDGSMIRKLTNVKGVIDVSPDWSPDESKIVFCSDRSGGPQIFTMNRDGSNVRRISRASSNYCTSPAWSPKGDRIAFVCRADRGYNLFTSNPDGTETIQLTSGGNNEDPSWSPDGRYIAFATTFGKGRDYNIALIRNDGSNLQLVTTNASDDTEPSWGPPVF